MRRLAMKYILKAVSLRHKEDEDPYYGLDTQYIPEGARIELVETRWFGEKKAKIKQWVIDISTVEELHKLAKWAQCCYGTQGNSNEALIIINDSELEYPTIYIYDDYYE